jgi:hypothetical protein
MRTKWSLITCLVAILARTAPAAWTPLQTDFGPYLRIVSTNDDVIGLRLGLFSENWNVYGSSVSFWSDTINSSGGGLQVALWRSTVKHSFIGIQAALTDSEVHDTLTGVSISLRNSAKVVHGIQLGGIVGEGWDMAPWTLGSDYHNFETEDLVGAQIGLFVAARHACGMQLSVLGPETDDLIGIQSGFCPIGGEVHGIQLGAINGAGEVRGIQLGLLNFGADVYGIQLGAYNWSDTIDGLQFGILNVTETLQGLQIGLLNYVGEGSPSFMPFINLRF